MNSFFLGVYMLAANIMLVNLLVALFATTYEIVQVQYFFNFKFDKIILKFIIVFQENSEKIWKLNRYDLVIEYWGKGPIPTPFVLIEHLFLLIKMIIFCRNPKERLKEC